VAIFNGRHFGVLHGFSSGSPSGELPFAINYDRACHFAWIALGVGRQSGNKCNFHYLSMKFVRKVIF